MNQFQTKPSNETSINLTNLDIRFVAVPLSFLLSLYAVFFELRLNDDGYTYIKTAQIFIDQGVVAAFDHHFWATFSIIIGSLHQLLNIGIIQSAFLLNSFFYALIVYSFISIVLELRPSKKLGVIAAITILAYPALHEYRYMITRDPAYWSLTLLALWQFVRFTKNLQFKYAIAFSLFSIVAAFFRPEALALLFALPLSLLFNYEIRKEKRVTQFLKLQLFSLLSLISLMALALLFRIDMVGNLLGVVDIYSQFLMSIDADKEAINQAVFSDHARDKSGSFVLLFLAAGLLPILIIRIISGLTIPFFITIIYGVRKKYCSFPNYFRPSIIACLLITLVTLLGFIFITRFITTRYTLLFCLISILSVPFIIETAYDRLSNSSSWRTFGYLIGLLVVWSFVDTYKTFGDSKAYYFNASDWMVENVDNSTLLITNNHFLAYESGRIENYDKVQEEFVLGNIFELSPGTLVMVELRPEIDQWLQQGVKNKLLILKAVFPVDNKPKIAAYQRLPN